MALAQTGRADRTLNTFEYVPLPVQPSERSVRVLSTLPPRRRGRTYLAHLRTLRSISKERII